MHGYRRLMTMFSIVLMLLAGTAFVNTSPFDQVMNPGPMGPQQLGYGGRIPRFRRRYGQNFSNLGGLVSDIVDVSLGSANYGSPFQQGYGPNYGSGVGPGYGQMMGPNYQQGYGQGYDGW